MTFSEILTALYDDLYQSSTPASAVTARLKRYVNQGLRVLLNEPGLARLRDSDAPHTFASVASQARYVVPEAVARILHVSERTNDRTLGVMSLSEYRHLEADPASVTGTPTHIVPIGRTAVSVQPADASRLFVDSTSASDTNTAYVEGLVSGGYLRSVSKTMTGTTAVDIDTSITDWIEVTDFYLGTAAVGTVTLVEDASGGTELARITIGQKRPRYYAFYLWPTPAAAVTYYMDYRRELTELVNDADEPNLPTDFHYLLVAYARMREYEKADDSRYRTALAEWQHGLGRLKYSTQVLADETAVMGRGRITGHSRLGAYYPADYWRG
jgi:hypothetical protein